jgi:hypothetical protein
MKTTKLLVVALAALFIGTTAVNAQTAEKIEVPNWCVKQAIEYVNKMKIDVKVEPADSIILVEEYALRIIKGNNAYKAATTDEEKKASSGIAYKEYLARIKNRVTPTLYYQIMKWHIDQSKKK